MRLRADSCRHCVRVLRVFVGIASATAYASLCTATNLPVGPITFGSNSDYDNNFKEAPPPLNEIHRSANGYLELLGPPTTGTGIAVFDTSATGGHDGYGGTGGLDANSDLSDFTISADLASSVAGGIGAAFLLRLDEDEDHGYLAGAHFFPPFTTGPRQVAFDIFEGAGFTEAGSRIFHQEVPVPNTPLADTFYSFKLILSEGIFSFDFDNGAATASFTDPSVTATIGQVGIVLDAASPSAATRLDNLKIAPEPPIGDFDENGVLDAGDIDQLSGCLRTGCQDPLFDLNSDDTPDQKDHHIWVKDLKNTWYGDANLDDEFNSSDMTKVFAAGKYETREDAGWAEGDWNGDGLFASSDMVTAFADGGYEQGPRTDAGAVPEPGGWLLLMLAVPGLLSQRECTGRATRDRCL